MYGYCSCLGALRGVVRAAAVVGFLSKRYARSLLAGCRLALRGRSFTTKRLMIGRRGSACLPVDGSSPDRAMAGWRASLVQGRRLVSISTIRTEPLLQILARTSQYVLVLLLLVLIACCAYMVRCCVVYSTQPPQSCPGFTTAAFPSLQRTCWR